MVPQTTQSSPARERVSRFQIRERVYTREYISLCIVCVSNAKSDRVRPPFHSPFPFYSVRPVILLSFVSLFSFSFCSSSASFSCYIFLLAASFAEWSHEWTEWTTKERIELCGAF